MNQKLLILAGLPGSGKSEAAKFFSKVGLTVIRMGDLTDEYLRRTKIVKNEENEARIRDYLRKKFGSTVYARFTAKSIRSLTTANTVIIEGARSLPEVAFLKRKKTNVKIIWLEAEKSVRYQRLKNRLVRPLSFQDAQKRDQWEKNTMDIEKIKDQADFVLDNNQTLAEFYNKLRLLKLLR